MGQEETGKTNPKQGIWRRFLLLIPLTIVLGLASCVHIRHEATTYTTGGYTRYTDEEYAEREVVLSDPSVLEVVSTEHSEYGGVFVTVRARSDGDCVVSFVRKGQPESETDDTWNFRVFRGLVFTAQGDFNGWQALHVSLLVLFAALIALFTSCFVRLWRASWYGYTMVICVACVLFFAAQLLLFGAFLVRGSFLTVTNLLSFLGEMVPWFALGTMFPMFFICLLVSLSNVSLIRHEGRRPVNMLGIAASIAFGVAYYYLLTGGVALNLSMVSRALRFLLIVALTFGVGLLFAIMICAGIAAHHRPRRVMDYIVILGCGIRADGTPCPLLAGRVDKAVAYAKELETGGEKPAFFVPSGGQGPDEPMSEAQSMRDYLIGTHGIDPERIVMEDRSTTTRENMRFSRDVIERHAGRDVSELSVGFSTTNYHVFRGYVCAHNAGMDVEGMGSKTKYYFWPNAFLREFIGLLVAKWRMMLLLFGILCAISFVVERLSGMFW